MRGLQRGFTLIELMIVVAIIAILAAIAIPAYQDYVIRSQVSEGIYLAEGAKTSVWDFFANNGRFPPGNQSAGMMSPASIIGNYVSGVTVTNGVISVAFAGAKANKAIQSGSVILSPTSAQGGSTKWTCRSTNLPAKYLPSACR